MCTLGFPQPLCIPPRGSVFYSGDLAVDFPPALLIGLVWGGEDLKLLHVFCGTLGADFGRCRGEGDEGVIGTAAAAVAGRGGV